ncbi:hypothetical protein JW921_05945 [Candidatus Fermentibacterales bacterium]|nr:hypothetical protein [Candidatus Fermentibacterales bacterium]
MAKQSVRADVWSFYRSGLSEELVADNPMEAMAAYGQVEAAIEAVAHLMDPGVSLVLEMRAGSLYIVRKEGS